MTSRKHTSTPDVPAHPGPAPVVTQIRHPNLRALQVLQQIADRDTEQQRRDWELFRAAIDEDRAPDAKRYPCPDE